MSALNAIVSQLVDVQTSSYVSIAGFVLLIYDHLITLEDELDFIWTGSYSTVKLLFIFNRYIAPFVLAVDIYATTIGALSANPPRLLSLKFCQTWVAVEGSLTILIYAAIHAMVAFRVAALWSNDRRVVIPLILMYVLYIGSTGAIWVFAARETLPQIQPHPLIHICFGTFPPYMWALWLPNIVFEVAVFALTLAKAWQHTNVERAATPILNTLYRDGFLYFGVVFLTSMFNLLIWSPTITPFTLSLLAKVFTSCAVVTCGSRLVLDLREAAVQSRSQAISSDGKLIHHGETWEMSSRAVVETINLPLQLPPDQSFDYQQLTSQRATVVKFDWPPASPRSGPSPLQDRPPPQVRGRFMVGQAV
jgi:hypothetical protein